MKNALLVVFCFLFLFLLFGCTEDTITLELRSHPAEYGFIKNDFECNWSGTNVICNGIITNINSADSNITHISDMRIYLTVITDPYSACDGRTLCRDSISIELEESRSYSLSCDAKSQQNIKAIIHYNKSLDSGPPYTVCAL